ncbi:hypothetical protein WN944_010840 [Citrus x changshan-huyou]|uniref:Uncharacterized protein n=1 Tax=Citrus x changshan-huyou TaxID=2935761 RepID=A0AAP0MSD1_9ROSI
MAKGYVSRSKAEICKEVLDRSSGYVKVVTQLSLFAVAKLVLIETVGIATAMAMVATTMAMVATATIATATALFQICFNSSVPKFFPYFCKPIPSAFLP